MYNRLTEGTRARVRLLVLMGPSEAANFEIRLSSLLGRTDFRDNLSTLPEMERIPTPGGPLLLRRGRQGQPLREAGGTRHPHRRCPERPPFRPQLPADRRGHPRRARAPRGVRRPAAGSRHHQRWCRLRPMPGPKRIEINDQFRQALELMDGTDRHVFVTGKAGTGKSTLLEHFRSVTRKEDRRPRADRRGRPERGRPDRPFVLPVQARRHPGHGQEGPRRGSGPLSGTSTPSSSTRSPWSGPTSWTASRSSSA